MFISPPKRTTRSRARGGKTDSKSLSSSRDSIMSLNETFPGSSEAGGASGGGIPTGSVQEQTADGAGARGISVVQIADANALTQQTNNDLLTIGLGTVPMGRGRGSRPATPSVRDNSRSPSWEYAIENLNKNLNKKLDELDSRVIGRDVHGRVRT